MDQAKHWITLNGKSLASRDETHSHSQAQYQKIRRRLTILWRGTSERVERTEITGWQSRPNTNWASSWEWAELDQAAMTVSLVDGSMKRSTAIHPYLRFAVYAFWPQIRRRWRRSKNTQSSHWGNGYHQFERMLIGYLFAQQLTRSQQYYITQGRPSNWIPMEPYYYRGIADLG